MKNNRSEGSQTSLDKLYEQITAIVETSIFDIGNVINAIVNLDQNNLELQMQDLIHLEMEFGIKYDLIVERLYSRETILFSRSDRFVLVERIDAVFDHVLNDSRRAYSYQPTEIPPAVSSYLLQIAQNIQSIGTPLKRAIIFLFSDFKKAEGLILEIRKLGKEARSILWQTLRDLFQHTENFRDLLYFDRFLRDLRLTYDHINDLGNTIRSLVIKYRI